MAENNRAPIFGHHKTAAAAVFTLCLLIGTGCARPLAAETTVSKPGVASSALPYCINSASDIAEIQRIQEANKKSSHKYDGYRDSLQASPDWELAARLAYAETVAANCPDQQDQVTGIIASVIGNRVRIRKGDVNSVVFQRDQFASSLDIYPESRYRDFLCPRDEDLWIKILNKMRVNLEGQTASSPIPKDAVNYYLYKHSSRFKAPDWELNEAPIPEEKARECIRAFRDPKWK